MNEAMNEERTIRIFHWSKNTIRGGWIKISISNWIRIRCHWSC